MRTKRRLVLLALPAAALLLLLAGVTAVFGFQVVSVRPTRSLEQMLPATTVFYLSVDLNPSGTTRSAVQSFKRDFTGQPGWANVVREFAGAERKTGSAQGCFQGAKQQADSYLQYLGHDTALALLGTRGINLAALDRTGLTPATQRNLVVVASVNYHATLAQILFGSPFSQLQKEAVYRGTAIYREDLAACGETNPSTPRAVYGALYRGYVVLGFRPDPIERVLDTAAGSVPSLAANRTYRELTAQLPGGRLARFYLDGKALRNRRVFGKLANLPAGSAQLPFSQYQSSLQPVASALTVDESGLHLVQTAWNPSAVPGTPAGEAASFLPADLVGLLSVQGVPGTVKRISAELKNARLTTAGQDRTLDPTLRDLTSSMTGEADLVMFRPEGALNARTGEAFNIPLSLMWQVKDEVSASRGLDAIINRLHAAAQFKPAVAADGTPYHAIIGGPGYAVRKGWVITSLGVGKTLDRLSAGSSAKLASVPAYRAAVPTGAVPSSIWYVNLRQLRQELESSLLPMAGASGTAQYRKNVLPLLAPLQTLSGSAGVSKNRRVGISITTVRVSKP